MRRNAELGIAPSSDGWESNGCHIVVLRAKSHPIPPRYIIVCKNLTIDTPKTPPTDGYQPVELCWFESHSCTASLSGQNMLLRVLFHSESLPPSNREGCNLTHCDFNNRFCSEKTSPVQVFWSLGENVHLLIPTFTKEGDKPPYNLTFKRWTESWDKYASNAEEECSRCHVGRHEMKDEWIWGINIHTEIHLETFRKIRFDIIHPRETFMNLSFWGWFRGYQTYKQAWICTDLFI